MSNDQPNYPKFKLKQRIEDEPVLPPKVPEATMPQTSLELKQAGPGEVDDEQLTTTAEILEDAYGESKRERRRRERMALIYGAVSRVVTMFLFFIGTLVYAHVYKGWPVMVLTTWYLPFLLSAILSVWVGFQSISYWKEQSWLMALFGILFVGLSTYWNLRVLECTAQSSEKHHPSNGMWAPTSVNDLLITVEVNAAFGVPATRATYLGLPIEAYRRAFNEVPRAQWRPYFERYLSYEEMKRVNGLNVNENMYLVVARMQAKRREVWDAYEAELAGPQYDAWIKRQLLKPYTILLSRL